MYLIIGYCAGIVVFEDSVSEESRLKDSLAVIKENLKDGKYRITFALTNQVASEICVDVFEKSSRIYRPDLSKAFKK